MPASSDSRLTLVLPGFLTEAAAAGELARHVTAAPTAATLLEWLQAAPAQEQAFDVLEAGCTAREAWWLERAGHRPEPGGKIGAGLAPLLAPRDSAGAPVWLAELAHIQVGRDGLALTDPARLELADDDSAALLQTALPALAGAGFGADPVGSRRWRIHPPAAGGVQHTGTPEAVAGHPLDSWWPRGEAARPWRRLVNEVQMHWHEHPVNAAREARGLPAVNAVWLHGGGAGWQPWPHGGPRLVAGGAEWQRALAERAKAAWLDAAQAAPAQLTAVAAELPDLLDAERAQDWHAWLAALPRLERDWFAPAAQALRAGALAGVDLVLPGQTRIVTLRIDRRPPLLRWLPQPKHDWKHWWLPRES